MLVLAWLVTSSLWPESNLSAKCFNKYGIQQYVIHEMDCRTIGEKLLVK